MKRAVTQDIAPVENVYVTSLRIPLSIALYPVRGPRREEITEYVIRMSVLAEHPNHIISTVGLCFEYEANVSERNVTVVIINPATHDQIASTNVTSEMGHCLRFNSQLRLAKKT